jgi:hypothetical protein
MPIATSLLSTMLALGGVAEPPREGLAVGEAFPVLLLPGLEDGAPRSVADWRGRKLLLHVFASW